MDQAAEIHDVYEKITQQINKNREVLSSFEVNTGALSKQDFSLNHYRILSRLLFFVFFESSQYFFESRSRPATFQAKRI